MKTTKSKHKVCPRCKSKNWTWYKGIESIIYTCNSCKKIWEISNV